jgi:S-adenosylmethionine hydrolase
MIYLCSEDKCQVHIVKMLATALTEEHVINALISRAFHIRRIFNKAAASVSESPALCSLKYRNSRHMVHGELTEA